jgi:hypothetical protein
MLKHVRAEEVTVSQRAKRRNESQKKYNERSGKIERPASLLENKKVANESNGAKN